MFPAFRNGHGERKPFPVCKIKGIGRLAFFPSLIADFFPAAYSRSVASVKIHT